MKNFEQIFCEEHRCEPGQFRRRLFWKTVPLHARPLVGLLGGRTSQHFEAERKLAAIAGEAADMNDVRTAINDYLGETADRGWLRGLVGVGMSTRQLRTVARCYLPGSGSRPADPFRVFQKIAS